jgi:ABC-2 type transport system permease protein
MREVFLLMLPRYLSFKNEGISQNAGNHRLRQLLFVVVGALFWAGAFVIFYRVLRYFRGIDEFGDILAHKLLSMVIMTFFSLLIFSGVVVSLSKLYLSRDLILVHSLPVTRGAIFRARWLESTLDSSWMALFFSMPVFLSYGIVYKAGLFYYATAGMAILSLCMTASALSVLLVLTAAWLLPAGRIRTLFVFLGLLLVVALILAFRMMRPERLVNPETFASLVLYLRDMGTAGSPFLPTTWVLDSISSALENVKGTALFHLTLSWSFVGALGVVVNWCAELVYFKGFTKSQTSSERLLSHKKSISTRNRWFSRFLSRPVRGLVVKEMRTFFRDQTQWTQLFLIAALIAIYLYNFSVLPVGQAKIRTVYVQNIFSFLNMGLAAFVLTAIAARFVYPAVSCEGEAFWIIRTSPVELRKFLRVKFFIYYLPLLVLAEILIVSSNILLQVTPFMMALSVVTIFLLTPGIVALGIGLGAAYPDFHSENPSQSVTGFGGLLFMLLSAGFITLVIMIEAGPVYRLFMADIRGATITGMQAAWTMLSFLLVLILCVLAVVLPMRFGERRLERQK